VSGFPTARYLPPYASREEWLTQRRLGIGGSDASIIMGFNRYTSTLDLWDEKRSKAVPSDDVPSEAAWWGNALEPIVAERLQGVLEQVDEGYYLRPPDGILQNIERPYLLASLDRIVYREDTGNEPVGIAEVKTVGLRNAGEWGDEGVAMHALWQGIHYMAVTGLPVVHFGCLIGGQEFRYRSVYRTDVADLEEQLLDACEEFWKHVENGTEPPLVGFSDANLRSLSRRYPEAIPESSVEVPTNVAAAIEAYRVASDLERSAKAAKDEMKQVIAEALKDAEAATYGGEVLATFKATVRKTIDTTALKAEKPAIAAQYMKSSVSRTLRVA